MSKYNNKKITVDGITFDSKKEARRYTELKLLERAGKITNLHRQTKWVLIPAQFETVARYGKNGQRIKSGRKCIERECAYIADFDYRDENFKHIVEDTKGVRTKDYIIKRKLMLHKFGIKIKEV